MQVEPTAANVRMGHDLFPVSYTHLDVYKRQILKKSLNLWNGQKLLKYKTVRDTKAVSYTHLICVGTT